RRIRAEHPSHPYAGSWWPIGQGVGYGASFGNQVADLLEGWPDAPWSPGFGQGAAVQAVCDAVEASAAQGRGGTGSEVTRGGAAAPRGGGGGGGGARGGGGGGGGCKRRGPPPRGGPRGGRPRRSSPGQTTPVRS